MTIISVALDKKTFFFFEYKRKPLIDVLVCQINTMPCKMTLVVLRTAQCKLIKVENGSLENSSV